MRTRIALLSLSLLLSTALACGSAEPVAEATSPDVTPAAAPEAEADTPAEPGIEALGVPQLHTPEPGLATGGQITPEQMDALRELGYGTFISLRPASEEGADWEEAHAAEAGLHFVRIPVAGREGLTRDNAELLAQALAGSGPDSPALVYCASGNRVGALLALKEHWLDGLDAEAALEYGRDAGMTRLEGAVQEILGR